MNRAAVIQAAYFACLAVGEEPSVRNVTAMVKRICSKGIRGEFVRVWLAQKRQRDTLGIQPGYGADTPLVLKNEQRDTPQIQDGYLHTRAAKVLELEARATPSDKSSGVSDTPPALFEPAVMEPRTGLKKAREQAPMTVAGHAIRDRIGKRVAPYLRAMTLTTWKLRNAHDAEDMAKAGVTPEEAEQAWTDCFARTGKPMLFVRDVVKYLQSNAARASPNNTGTNRGTPDIMAAQAARRAKGAPADDHNGL